MRNAHTAAPLPRLTPNAIAPRPARSGFPVISPPPQHALAPETAFSHFPQSPFSPLSILP